MKSTIGNYVHLKAENYIGYGTAKKGEEVQPWVKSLKAQRDKNMMRLKQIKEPSKDILKELEKRIANENVQKQAKEIAENKVAFSQSLDQITSELKKKLIAEVPKKFAFPDSGIRLVQSNIKTNKNMTNIEAAKKARALFSDNIKTINNNTKEGKPIQARTLNTLLKNLSDFFNYLGIVNNNLDFIKYRNLDNRSTIAALEGLIQLDSLSEINKATLHGVYGEALVNMVSDNCRTLVGKELEKTVKDALATGETRTSFQMDESMIESAVQQDFLERTGLNLYQIRSTQDKVDASIIINNEEINASVKTYTPKNNYITAHLQDVSLISSLVSTEEQFGNHWLNLHALNTSADRKRITDEEFAKHIQYEALAAGNLLKKGAAVADTFVAIDAVQGRVYAKSVKDILTNNTKYFSLKPPIASISIANERAETYHHRIANILLELHQKKISVGYKVLFR